MAEPLTLYKLIVLYMMKKVDFPLTNSQISEFILDKGYTTYFKLQQAISELIESAFVEEETVQNRTFYHITDDGAETIQFFKNNISPAIKQDIDEFLKERKYELRNETAIKADYYRNTNMEYSVRCQVVENELPIIDLTITVPTESEAEIVANNWKKKNQEIYAMVMSNLL